MNASMTALDDNALVVRAIAGEAESYAILMHRHAPTVRQLIASKLPYSSAEVEDLVQETFLKAWLGLPGFRFQAKFRTWLSQVALNEVLTLYRRNRSRPACLKPADLGSLQSMVEPAYETARRAEISRMIRSAVSKLPPNYRDTFTLCDLDELSEREAAQVSGSTIPAVKARRFRGRKMLSAALVGLAA
jgi:RNA polymerase sigma-70 factor, ECF subfamily